MMKCPIWLALVALGGCELVAGIDAEERTLSDGGGDSNGDGDGVPMSDGGKPDTGTPPPGGPSEICLEYCAVVMGACVDEYAVYTSENVCREVCARLEDGDPEEPTGNTVACRLKEARNAVDLDEPSEHCPAAGPGGAGRTSAPGVTVGCGDNCESYCRLFEDVCADEPVPDCETRCKAIHDRDEDDDAFGTSSFHATSTGGDHEGDTVQCRLVHLSAAASAPAAHCWHSEIAPRSLMSTGSRNPCTYLPDVDPPCEDYCRLNLVACADQHAQYESRDQCLNVCAGIDPGDGADGTAGGQDTVGCRIAHSYNAFGIGAPEKHCSHSGPGGQGPCGSHCTSYCRALEEACQADFAGAFADQAACRTACDTREDSTDNYSVPAGQAGGDTLGCRILHAARAFDDANMCAAALGGAPCN